MSEPIDWEYCYKKTLAQHEILRGKLAAVRTWFHKLCPRGAESSEMMKLERIIGDVGVEKDSPPQPEKPDHWNFQCPFCGWACMTERVMKAHLKREHGHENVEGEKQS